MARSCYVATTCGDVLPSAVRLLVSAADPLDALIHCAALDCAREAASGKDIRIGGGVAVVRQYLQAKLVDETHFAITPALLGSGEHVCAGMNLPALG